MIAVKTVCGLTRRVILEQVSSLQMKLIQNRVAVISERWLCWGRWLISVALGAILVVWVAKCYLRLRVRAFLELVQDGS